MSTETTESVPRDFYDGIVSIREALLDYGLDEDAVEQVLDQIESIIVEALEQVEGDTDSNSQDDKSSSK
jgi:hypothetical protein